MPSEVRRSILGVISGVLPPKQPGESQFISSAVIRRMFGRFLSLMAANTGTHPNAIIGTPKPIALISFRRVIKVVLIFLSLFFCLIVSQVSLMYPYFVTILHPAGNTSHLWKVHCQNCSLRLSAYTGLIGGGKLELCC